MADTGQQLLESVFRTLQVDDAWSEKGERAFNWIAHRLQQRVTAHKPVTDRDFTLYKMTAETTVIEAVTASAAEVNKALSQLNRFAFGSAYSYDPETQSVSATTSTWVHDETAGWRGKLFDLFSIGQLCFAETEADYLADRCRGVVARRSHPTSGQRVQPDDMLHLVEDFIALGGDPPNRFANPFQFEAVADMAKHTPFLATLGADRDGVALERCFDNWTAVSIITSSLRHRRAGSGLASLIQLPNTLTEEEGYSICAVLNRKEREEGPLTSHFGAWSVDKGPSGAPTLTYRGFYPAVSYQDGLIMDMAMICNARMGWADQQLNGKATRGSAWERLANRLGMGKTE